MRTYREFINSKHLRHESSGIEIAECDLNQKLFDWQRHIVQWALRQGRAALFADCGLGKSFMQLEWANQLHLSGHAESVILFCPIAVSEQTLAESGKFGIESPIRIVESHGDVEPGINVTNYEKLHKFDCGSFDAVVLDECFHPDTKVDCIANGRPSSRPISDFKVGDKFINASGVDVVSDVHRREVPYGVKVTVGGSSCIASPNHPFFTQRGWVGAQHLRAGDYALQTDSAMRLVCSKVSAEVSGPEGPEVLRSILLSEMADVPTGDCQESPRPGSGCETWSQEVRLVQIWERKSREGTGKDSEPQSNVTTGCQEKSVPPIEGDRPQTFRAWGEWNRDDRATAVAEGCTVRELDGGVFFVTGPTSARLPDSLQAGLSIAGEEDLHRSGWELSQREKGSGQKKDGEAEFVRVDGIEILEPGHPELDQARSADGKLYFYDLGGTRHPSFSVNGLLVHNSSILKSYTGATKRALLESFADTKYRLACTATPAPNDLMELGNHAEFLGIMPSNEMLARWFINDSGNTSIFRLKGHARRDFWQWVSSWAKAASKPSDVGDYDDSRYALPALNLKEVIVKTETPAGFLFHPGKEVSATTVHQEKRASLDHKADAIAELVDNGELWVCWVDTDYEADALTERIADAVEVRGSMKESVKRDRLRSFSDGGIRVMVTKPEIGGFGLNWQHCHNMTYMAGFSFERWYQSVRRMWRFGQAEQVNVHLVMSEAEESVKRSLDRKMKQHAEIGAELCREIQEACVSGPSHYEANKAMEVPEWLTTAAT